MKPISQTAYYCCGARMQDAEKSHPICGDSFAKLFMNDDGHHIFQSFKNDNRANAGNSARHRIIDDYIQNELRRNPHLQIVVIGAGFDSRAYRLNGGNWLELDEPAIIEYKNEKLPTQKSKNKLHRISIDFATESVASKLRPFANNGPVIFIIEGVFVYLTQEAIQTLLKELRSLFPQHELICDLMTSQFFRQYGRPFHRKIEALGASFQFVKNKPDELFLENGYECTKRLSIPSRATKFGFNQFPKILSKTFLSSLWGGYAVYVFKTY